MLRSINFQIQLTNIDLKLSTFAAVAELGQQGYGLGETIKVSPTSQEKLPCD
jgi:hypothetical protein